MDVLVIWGVLVLLTIVAYLLGNLGTKEMPFEEALAKQRQEREMENAQNKSERIKKPKDKKVKKKKEETEPLSSATPAEVEQESKVTTLPPQPVPPQQKTDPEPAAQQFQSKKKKEKKEAKSDEVPNKINIQEVVKEEVKLQTVLETSSEPATTKENKKELKKENKEAKAKEAKKEIKEGRKEIKEGKKENKESKKEVKDEKEVKEVSPDVKETKKDNKENKKETKESKKENKEVKKDKPSKETKEVKNETKKPVVEAAVVSAEAVTVEAAVEAPAPVQEKPQPAQEKKKKKEKPKVDSTTLSESKLLPMIQRAPLSGTEIQTLIDVLLNKQQQNNAGGDWVKKGRVDPITQLKRHLEEAENRLRDKDEAHLALSTKITDLCSELHGERSRISKLKVQLDESSATHARQQEAAISNVKAQHTSRLNELRAALEQEFQTKLQQQQQIIEQLQKASNEKELTVLRSSLSKAEMQGKMLKQEHEEISQRCQQYEEHIRALEEKRAGEEATRTAQIRDLENQLQNSDAARAQALSSYTSLEGELEALNSQVTTSGAKIVQLQHTLQEKICEKSDLETRLMQLESDLCSARQVVTDQNNEIERLKEEKESLASQSVRPAAEGQENGDVHSEHPQTPDTLHLESLVKEKDRLLEEQVSEVDNLNKEISRLKEDLKSQREKNDELREKNHKVLEALTITEEKLMARLKRVDEATGVVEEEKTKVRAVLRRIFPEVVVDDQLDQGAFLSEFESKALQAATQTAQQPEPQVVEKVVEVIKVVEKEVEVKVEDPDLKLRVEKLSEENTQLKIQVADLEKSSSEPVDDSQRVKELEDEVHTVNEKVVHYQTVLADTENLLKSLEASVESEEITWKKRLSEKENDLKQLVADKANLQLQVKQLEDTLDKVEKAENMQKQLEMLKEQLQKEEKEKISLLEKLQKAQEELAQTASQSGVGNDETSLRELKAENDKLRALVDVGQDASRQQEDLIDQLQKELAATKTVSTNGPVSQEPVQEGASGTQ